MASVNELEEAKEGVKVRLCFCPIPWRTWADKAAGYAQYIDPLSGVSITSLTASALPKTSLDRLVEFPGMRLCASQQCSQTLASSQFQFGVSAVGTTDIDFGYFGPVSATGASQG